ncbi:MAG: lysophospholipid acyltransferase family protein [Bacteroidetes bacterium]|jgi:predicted LPLAT superfamily acyltransferase|nr:lysophospholipid acyltransferase family protein [Bacteroidota bacterium]
MSQWDGRSKGTALGYRIFIYLIDKFGVKAAYRLLWFVSYYYYLFGGNPKKNIINFYTKALQMPLSEAKKLCRKNFYYLGQTLIDRNAFLLGKAKAFTHHFENEEFLVELQQQNRGGILISAHIGNWETAGNLLHKRISKTINVLMLEAEEKKIKKVLDETTGGARFNIIAIKNDLSHIVKINNALEANELIAMHADRFTDGVKTITLDFLGKKARFPWGPFLIASKFNAPVTFVFALKDGDFHYELSATKPLTGKYTPEEIAKLYVEELEKKVKKYPVQWFNYYDFYKV